uniref:Uncharacterized protein n=1 Tax=Panagrolaimus davidi TaxID=227884 RepID=A0A914P4X6_9BILA
METHCNPLPKEALILYLKTEKLYEAIIAEKNNFDKWFDLICQVRDTKYILNNIEYRIGNDMTNKELWKLYINYLQKNDTKRLLYIYSCYCRFFLDDENMKEEYRTACEKFGPSIVHWKNAFDFEIFVNDEITEEMVKQNSKNQHASKKLNFDRKFIISNTFHCFHGSDKLMLSKFLPNIFQCNIKHLRIDKQNFTFKEYEFLVGYGNVETLTMQNVELINDKKEIIELQEILILTPKIIEFDMSEPKITEQTFQILAQLNFLNKFKIFKLYYIEYLEPYGLAEFMKS